MMTLAALAAQFAAPPIAYSPIPFWFLNGDLEPAELTRQLKLMRAIGIGAVVLHARTGHDKVPYLTDEWFAMIRHCVDTCAELGMQAWLYDEDNFPSGYAGGEVMRRTPNAQAKCLAMVDAPEEGDVLVAAADGHSFVQRLVPWQCPYSTDMYVDLLDRQVTDTFIACTHEVYAKTLGEHMGTTVTAIFTDEPGFYNHFHHCVPDTIPWTGDMLEEFKARAGYDLVPHLPKLFEDRTGDAGVRRDFYRVVSQLICERFYAPLKEWCHAHGIKLVGHVNNEEYLVDHVRYNADFFSAMDGLDFPGMDLIGPPGDSHRLPDSFVPRLAASAAHTRGKTQIMSETYGAAGWDLTAEEVRRLADWQFVRGVTRLVPHAFYYSIDGPRYHECPPSFFFQSPLWPYMPGLVSYMTRWTWLLESTRPVPGVAVYYPIEAVREVTSPQVPRSLGPGLDETQAGQAGAFSLAFRRITDGLFRSRVDYDVVDDVALRGATVAGGRLQIADLSYGCLVIPPGGLSEEARGLVRALQDAGLEVIHARGDGAPEETLGFATVQVEPASDQITSTRRRTATGDLFFIVNEGTEKFEGTVTLPATGKLTHWDLGAGQVDEWKAEVGEGATRVTVTLLGGTAVCFGVEEG